MSSAGEEADTALAGSAFRALAEGGDALGWEPLFFDWFGGEASQNRAMNGPRAQVYRTEAFTDFRARLAEHAPDRPERLASNVFQIDQPQTLLYDEIEAIWAAIAIDDDWAPFNAKLERLDEVRAALQPHA